MKLPFHSVLGPHLKTHYFFIKQLCNHPFVGVSNTYTMILGLVGVIFSVFDIFMILKCGPTLPRYLARVRADYGKVVNPTVERDLKLMGLLISSQYYFLLILGVLANNPIFFLPFLIINAFIIMMEFVTLFLRFFTDGFGMNRSSIFTSIFVVYNWSSVFCCFWQKMEYCDY